VVIGVAVLDIINRLAIEYAYSNLPEDSELKRTFRYTEDCDADLLILGASRGVYDYNTVMMSDSLHVKCQSISMEGMSVISQYISVKKAISGGKTKTIIYDLSSGQLSDDWVENQTSRYYPFYWKNNDVKTFVDEQQGTKMSYLMFSSFIQNNSMLFDIIYTGYIRKSDDKNGYIPLPYTGKKFNYKSKEDNADDTLYLNPTGERYLYKIINLCKSNGIRLILCDSPRLNYKKQIFDDYLEKVADKYQIEFWNYSDFPPIVSDNRFFKDHVHINSPGADLFTRDLINRLKGLDDAGTRELENVDRG